MVLLDRKVTKVGWDLQDDESNLEFFDTFVNPSHPQKQKVFFLGQHSKKWGYVMDIDRTYKYCMIKCDMQLEKGDSGGLLFCQEGNDPVKLIALGILCMIDKNAGVSYFTSSKNALTRICSSYRRMVESLVVISGVSCLHLCTPARTRDLKDVYLHHEY